VLPLDLLDTAHDLVSARSGRPKQGHLRRSVSSAYYAMFHALARCCADLSIGGSGSKQQTRVESGLRGSRSRRCENGLLKQNNDREISATNSGIFRRLRSVAIEAA